MVDSITINWKDSVWNVPLGSWEPVDAVSIRPVPARDGCRCGSCRFLDREAEGWRCANFVNILATRALKGMSPVSPQMRLMACLDWEGYPPRNPGWFACPLWLSGESMSTRAYREGHFGEFLTLMALAGAGEPHTEYRTHEGSQAQGDLAELERAGADMRRKDKWWKLLGTWNLPVDGYPGAPHPMSGLVSFGSTLSTKAASSFGGLLSLVTTDYLTQSEGASVEVSRHANCRCAIVDDVEDELE